MRESLKNLNVYSNFESNFLKIENHFQKTGVPLFTVVKSTNIENATFPYKTARSEGNVKIKRMGSTKWAYHKKRSFASNYFTFFVESFISV